MPWRGLDLLLDAFELLNRDDIELDVYSSTIIYGSEFHHQTNAAYETLFTRASKMKNVNYMGYAPNEEIRTALLNAHIFAYPSAWEETSCISAIEAAMAGLSLVTTNLGALYETLSEWPSPYVCWDSNRGNIIKNYAKRLNLAIDEFWCEATQERLTAQHNFFRRFWSWECRALEWEAFLFECRNAQSQDLTNN
jgi:glycosyltransferase involved in cell wall biosynthesis